MNEEIDQIEKNETWTLVPRCTYKNFIRRKWVFQNKLNEKGEITRNKARPYEKAMLKKKELIMGRHFPL